MSRERLEPFVGFMPPATQDDVKFLLELIDDETVDNLVYPGPINPYEVAKVVLSITLKADPQTPLFWLYPL